MNRGQPNYTHNAAIRQGRFKLVRPFVTRGVNLKDSTLPPVLYDLERDPTESTDIAGRRPDVAARLNGLLQHWADEVERRRLSPHGDSQTHFEIGLRLVNSGFDRCAPAYCKPSATSSKDGGDKVPKPPVRTGTCRRLAGSPWTSANVTGFLANEVADQLEVKAVRKMHPPPFAEVPTTR